MELENPSWGIQPAKALIAGNVVECAVLPLAVLIWDFND